MRAGRCRTRCRHRVARRGLGHVPRRRSLIFFFGSASSPAAFVYAHSADTLYRLDADTKQVAVVGQFGGGCDQVIDLAVDSMLNAYVTTSYAFYKLDLKTAACTQVSNGTYPNSLSFVPKGTVDPNGEALVGYAIGVAHRRTGTGAVTTIGSLSGGYQSSGDIVSVIGSGTFLTVKAGPGGAATSCRSNPTTGDIVQNLQVDQGTRRCTGESWAGTVYGFDNAGEMFSIDSSGKTLVTVNIPVPNPPPGLSFWGAGSTTAAPPKSADGGGIPVIQ